MELVLVFGINCTSAIFENFVIARGKRGRFLIYKNHEVDLSQKFPELNM